MSCPNCFSGHENPGTPKGTFKQLFGRRTYVSEPPSDKNAQGIIVIIPDAFGCDFINNQILADHYASAGPFLVFLPDFMDGGAAKVSTMKNMAILTDKNTSWLSTPYYFVAVISDFVPFMIRNRFGVSWPKVTSWLTALREEGQGATMKVGVAGFCWGGPHAVTLLHDRPDTKTKSGTPLADVSFTAHPSNLSVPKDLQLITRPLSVAIGDADFVMKLDQAKQAQAVLDAKTEVQTEFKIYPGAGHGFSIRASKAVPDSTETKQSEEAEEQAIAWFKAHL